MLTPEVVLSGFDISIYSHTHTNLHPHVHLPTYEHTYVHTCYRMSVYAGYLDAAMKLLDTLPAFVEFVMLSGHIL